MSKSIRVLAATVVLVATTTVAARASEDTHDPADAGGQAAASYVRCGYIGAEGRGRFKVIKKGSVSCRGARKLMNLFMNEGQGTKHGGPSNAETYYTLYGWKCGYGAGAGGCHRRGARVQAGWVP